VEKAPDAFRTISEVADDLDVPQHVLRFWETRFAQIRPMKRGGGRRYYRPDDVNLLRGIRHLLYGQGYTIRGVQRLLKDNGVKFVQGVWRADPPEAGDGAAALAHGALAPIEPDGLDDETSGVEEPDIPAEEDDILETSPLPDEPRPVSAPQPPRVIETVVQRPGLTGEQRQSLADALHELEACRQLLEAALKDE
jgi:DNA-binding transcriptional MerR regulator